MQLSPSAHLDTFCRDRLPSPDQWPELVLDLPATTYPDRLNAATELLDATIARWGHDRPCVRDAGTGWTYGDLLDRAGRIANVLTGLGVRPGNRVLLRGPNNAWLIACWFGVLKAGAVAVTTMPMLRTPELEKIVSMCRPTVALTDHRFAAELLAVHDAPTVVPYGGDTDDDLVARAARASSSFADVETAADDVALLAFTSGTTGLPKATMHFHRDVLAVADTFSAHVLDPRPDDVFAGSPPLAFTFGLGGLLIFPLRAGASVFLVERATPVELARLAAEHGVTMLFTAPTGYRAILGSPQRELLRGLRRAVSAGEALPTTVADDFLAVTGRRMIDGIGGTEMLHVFISTGTDPAPAGTTGKPVPGYRATILDADGRPVPDGTPGRLAVKGPTGCRYLNGDRQTQYVYDGWNVTGDVFVRDAEGYYYFRGRTDDMIVSSGYNIAGPEVEDVLMQHPDVAECAVVGAPDEARGAAVAAYVVLRTGVEPGPGTVRELQEFAKRTAAPYKCPRQVEFVDALPRTPSGKIERYVLRRWAAERAGAQAPTTATATSRTAIGENPVA
ncbi:AMP-binding protein [Pseudonocardia parietis]|uniref:2-aminobenzoate-CoA ligase n=1 Tax=Pseudonocardia parietis TaxID=570936 RepID=A0ABS4VPW5_9PSEU|nr:AMP-binding protein [Pseudonocardia parietis]MBP2365619.1 2-aminobenzoate-CoA ligase [Pseudonocardia parietis]